MCTALVQTQACVTVLALVSSSSAGQCLKVMVWSVFACFCQSLRVDPKLHSVLPKMVLLVSDVLGSSFSDIFCPSQMCVSLGNTLLVYVVSDLATWPGSLPVISLPPSLCRNEPLKGSISVNGSLFIVLNS